MQSALSFDRAPPFHLPVSFFLAAPCWLAVFAAECTGIDAGFIPESPLAYALTHTLALGVLSNVMLGALFQVLAVLSGITPRHPNLWLHGIFWPFQAGCAALVGAFLLGFNPALLTLAGILLGAALLAFSLGFSWAAIRTPAHDPSTRGIRLALIGLALAVSLGVTLTGIIGRGWALPLMDLLPRHIFWASNGWILMLLISVALTVVPMFQITDPYPKLLTRGLTGLLFAALMLNLRPLAALCAATFMLTTLYLQWHCRRRYDIGRKFWIGAMALGLIALLLWAWDAATPADEASEIRRLLIGWLWLAGLAMGAISAMLYKIVPFLIWLRLKALLPPRSKAPSMQSFINERAMVHSLWAWGIWVGCGVAAILSPAWGHLAVAASGATLASLLLTHQIRALLRYRALRNPSICQPSGLG